MGFFDDLAARVNEVVPEGIRNDIGGYLQARVVDPVVKIGQPATGNLSAEQIAAGQRGGAVPVAAPAAPASATMNASVQSAFASIKPHMTLILIGVAGVAVVMLLARKARK